MGRAEALNGHLPSLWRPGPDGDGPVVPFGPEDVVELVPVPPRPGAPTPVPKLLPRDPGVLVSFDRAGWPQRIRFRTGLAPGVATVLEVRRFAGGQPSTLATATVGVRAGVAVLPSAPAVNRVILLLRRRHLLDRWTQGVGAALDDASERAIEVMEAHWVETADAGLHSPWLLRRRQLGGLAPLDSSESAGQEVMVAFPWIRDLARVGALVPVAPWREPPAVADLVEGYRERIRRTVDLYRRGLGTVPALRRAVAAQLPIDPTLSEDVRDQPFTVEEFSPSVMPVTTAVAADGPPTDLVGPLMRWSVVAEGLAPAAPTVHVQGVTPVEGEIDPSDRPEIELLAAGGLRVRVALAYRQTVPPDRTLRLAPTSSTWLAGDDGVLVTDPLVGAEAGVAGPWTPAAEAPADVVDLARTPDFALWAATDTGAASSLWRHDGTAWTEELSGLPLVTALASSATDLVVATTAGVVRIDLHPAGGGGPTPDPDPAGLADPAVHVLLVEDDGTVLVGGDAGLVRLHPDGSTDVVAPDDDPARLGPVRAVARDDVGTLLVGGDDGLFLHQPSLDHWYAFTGEGVSETVADWVRLDGGDSPPDDPGLPAVRSVLRGPDATLWLGTDAGLARYRAVPTGEGALTSTTRLEAFPDLGTGRVRALSVDERGVVWAATARGLVSFDGRDLVQVAADATAVRLGRADRTHPVDAPSEDRGMWRFDRDGGTWQRWDRSGFHTTDLAVRGDDLAAVRVVETVDGVTAELLEGWDPTDDTSTGSSPVDPADLVVRLKPGDDTRVVDGGIPALPRVPPGPSTWRYLSLEPEDVSEPEARPAWTVEGRLLPPPDDRDPAGEGRYDGTDLVPERTFDEAVFAYRPAARVWMSWRARRPLTTLVRLAAGDPIDPAVLDRVWDGIQRARPAGVRAALAVGNDIIRGGV